MYDQVAGVSAIGPPIAGGSQLLSAAAKIGAYASFQPFRVRAVGFVVTVTCTATAPVVDFYRRPAAGSDTNRVLIKRLNPTLAQCAQGRVIMADGLNTLISPGEDLLVEVSTAATAGAGHPVASLEPQFENPANYTSVTKIA